MPIKEPKKKDTVFATTEAISVLIENQLSMRARANNEKKYDLENGHNPSYNATIAIRAEILSIANEAMVASGFETVCRNGNVKITRCFPKRGSLHKEAQLENQMIERSKFQRIDFQWKVARRALSCHMLELDGSFHVFVKTKKKVKSLIVEKKGIGFAQLWSCVDFVEQHPAEIFTLNEEGIISWVQIGSKKLI